MYDCPYPPRGELTGRGGTGDLSARHQPPEATGGRVWCEYSDLDHYGHEHGWKLAWRVKEQLREVVERIGDLFTAGWRRVRIVTDHG